MTESIRLFKHEAANVVCPFLSIKQGNTDVFLTPLQRVLYPTQAQ